MTEENRFPTDGRERAPATEPTSLTRRRFLAGGAAVVGGLALGTDALAGVRVRDRLAAAHTARAAAAPKRGGTLTIGSVGSTDDSLDPNKELSNMDLQRNFNFYDTLTYFPHNGFDLQYGLAQSIELTAGATVATVALRKGVEWHNGKSFTADDLIYSINRIIAPNAPHAGLLKSINPKAIKKVDSHTVQIGLNFADAIFPERWYVPQLSILPAGWDAKKPVGTGPFMFKSFTPGQRSVFVRNPNYWQSGKPYLDELVIIDLSDPTAQINALLSGQVDAIDSVPLNETSAISSRSNLKLLEANGGYFQPIVMRVDQKPFTDNRVREAFRLMVDRPGMIQQAYNGSASIGNDMPSHGDPSYPSGMPQRHQDIEKAKSLLKAAGHSNLTLTMTTANEDYGLVPGAEVFAQNAKQAGVTININVLQPSVWDPKFSQWPFTQGYWGNKPFGIMFSLLYAPGGIFNETHFNDAQANKIFTEALKDVNTSSRNEKLQAIEKILYERGGHIIHSFRKTVDAYSSKYTGFSPDLSTGWSLGQYRYKEVSLA
jgi:peptide/nickel transport system substrate-binding protein